MLSRNAKKFRDVSKIYIKGNKTAPNKKKMLDYENIYFYKVAPMMFFYLI